MQIVALNWQRCDAGTMINEAMFAGSGGWILKPSSMRDYKVTHVGFKVNSALNLNLEIELIAGINITLPSRKANEADGTSNSFYVNCYLHAVTFDELGTVISQLHNQKRKTNTVKGFNPFFNREKLRFSTVMHIISELSFIR